MVQVFAHRGSSIHAPENTMTAFETAVREGFHGIELDVRATADGVPVVLHDATLDRTTKASGRIDALDAANLPFALDGRTVPTLASLVAMLTEANWQGTLNVEIKDHRATRVTFEVLQAATELQWFISSMDPRVLAELTEHRFKGQQVPTWFIVLGPADEEDIEEAVDLDATGINLDADFATQETIAMARDAGLGVGVWTVNDPERAKLLASWNADAIITDSADVLAALALDLKS